MAEKINIVWVQGQGCSGDTVALLGAREPSLVDVLTGILPEVAGIVLAYHPTVMVPWGEEALSSIEAAEVGNLSPFVLVLEGSIPDEKRAQEKDGFWCGVGEKDDKLITAAEIINKLKDKAAVVVAVGTCASYGGIPHGRPNPTGAMGLLDFLPKTYKSTLGLGVICLPGCPAVGDVVIKALAYLVLVARGIITVLPELDKYHRPTFLYGERVHEVCPRAGYFASGKFSKAFGEPYCMGLLGCKGVISNCTVPRDGFTEGLGGCPTVGSICIGCTEPDFPEKPYSPFLGKAPAWEFVKEVYKDMVGHIYAGFHRLKKRKF